MPKIAKKTAKTIKDLLHSLKNEEIESKKICLLEKLEAHGNELAKRMSDQKCENFKDKKFKFVKGIGIVEN